MIYEDFRALLHTHSQHTGFHMPEPLHVYLAELMSSRLHRCQVIPEPSFGEAYLRLYHRPSLAEIADYADQCLWFVSFMPEYGQRRGLDITYYASLGISTYYTAGDLAQDPRFTQLGNWFYYLQRFLYSMLRTQGIPEYTRMYPELG